MAGFMSATDFAQCVEPSRAKRLKAATDETHQRLDQTVMACDPFSSLERYRLFLKMQHRVFFDVDALCFHPELIALLPDLPERRQLHLVEQDFADLGLVLPPPELEPVFGKGAIDVPTALGYLYVTEGSNLGAAFLIKEAKKIGLSESFGARHLAGAEEGRARSWRAFTNALDAVELSPEEEARAVAGAEASFERVFVHVESAFGKVQAPR